MVLMKSDFKISPVNYLSKPEPLNSEQPILFMTIVPGRLVLFPQNPLFLEACLRL